MSTSSERQRLEGEYERLKPQEQGMNKPERIDNMESNEPTPELCPRCDTEMEWRHQTFQCPHCKLKVGCCQGVNPDET